MLKLDGTRLRWDEEDVVLMAKVLGSENAAKRQASYVDSIVRWAKRLGLRTDDAVRTRYRDELHFRRSYLYLKDERDAPACTAREQRYFPHQRADLLYMRMASLSGYLLSHQPGVGKTLVAIDYAAHVVNARRILVICPNAIKEQWVGEIRTWDPKVSRAIHVVEGKGPQQIETAASARGWVIGHWESLVHARLGYLANPWDVVILDEAHHIQNRDAQRTATVQALRADYRVALTGHPFTNGLDELFPILQFLYPEQYTSFWRFAGMHVEVVPKPFGGMTFVGPLKPKLLQWELAPFNLRRTKAEVFTSLPPLTRVRRTAHLTATGEREYARLKKEFFAELEAHDGEPKILAIPSVLARITRLRQYLIDPALLGARQPSVKFPLVLDLLDEVMQPTVVFTMYKTAALNLAEFLRRRKRRTQVLHGGMARQIPAIKARFLGGSIDALIVVTQAGGTGLNLGRFGYVAHLDLPWHSRDLEQTEGRVDRPEEGTGRLVATTSYRFIVAGSYEEKMEKRLEKKHGQFREVFTVSDLKELFA